MRSEPDLVSAANGNFVASYRKLIEHVPDAVARSFGGAYAYVTGLPLGLFNGCVVVEPATGAELDAALEWVRQRGLPHRVFIAPDLAEDLVSVTAAHGLEEDSSPYPGMALRPVPEPPRPPPDVTIVPVDLAGLAEHLGVYTDGGLALDVAARLLPESMCADPELQLLTGRLEARPWGRRSPFEAETSAACTP